MAQSGRTFLVECYLPGVLERDVVAASERARRAAAELRVGGRDVDYLGALFVAADEAVFHRFRADDLDIVVEASHRAALSHERVVESIGVDGRGVDGGDLEHAGAIEPEHSIHGRGAPGRPRRSGNEARHWEK